MPNPLGLIYTAGGHCASPTSRPFGPITAHGTTHVFGMTPYGFGCTSTQGESELITTQTLVTLDTRWIGDAAIAHRVGNYEPMWRCITLWHDTRAVSRFETLCVAPHSSHNPFVDVRTQCRGTRVLAARFSLHANRVQIGDIAPLDRQHGISFRVCTAEDATGRRDETRTVQFVTSTNPSSQDEAPWLQEVGNGLVISASLAIRHVLRAIGRITNLTDPSSATLGSSVDCVVFVNNFGLVLPQLCDLFPSPTACMLERSITCLHCWRMSLREPAPGLY